MRRTACASLHGAFNVQEKQTGKHTAPSQNHNYHVEETTSHDELRVYRHAAIWRIVIRSNTYKVMTYQSEEHRLGTYFLRSDNGRNELSNQLILSLLSDL